VNVTIAIINYNYERYLPYAISSALRQDCDEPYEVVVVDDGSTDNSLAVASQFEPRVRVLSKRNGGMASAMNLAIDASRGECVIFLDADDLLVPSAVRTHLTAFKRDEVVRSMGKMQVVDANGHATGAHIPPVEPVLNDIERRVLVGGPGSYISAPASANAWRRNYLLEVAPLPETSFTMGGEPFLMDTAPLFGHVVWTNEVVVRYRTHDANMHGIFAALSASALTKTLAKYAVRSNFLEATARRRGYAVDADAWHERNWRIILIRRLLDQCGARTSATKLLNAIRHGGPTGPKGLALRAALPALALLPPRTANLFARSLLKLQYM
jgi:glycosyltransferase involved in cell wall biosynthesis